MGRVHHQELSVVDHHHLSNRPANRRRRLPLLARTFLYSTARRHCRALISAQRAPVPHDPFERLRDASFLPAASMLSLTSEYRLVLRLREIHADIGSGMSPAQSCIRSRFLVPCRVVICMFRAFSRLVASLYVFSVLSRSLSRRLCIM